MIAFFELCLTGWAEHSWRIARADDHNILSSKVGAISMDADPLKPRRNLFLSKGRAINQSSTSKPAPQLSRRISIGLYLAMLIFLVFCFNTFVAGPNGQSFKKVEDGQIVIGITESGTATEGPSSNEIDMPARIAVTFCLVLSFFIVIAYFIDYARTSNE